MPYEAALQILRKAKEYDCVREASVEGMMYVSDYDVETEIRRIFPNLREMMHTLRTPVPDVEDYFAARGVGAEKLLKTEAATLFPLRWRIPPAMAG